LAKQLHFGEIPGGVVMKLVCARNASPDWSKRSPSEAKAQEALLIDRTLQGVNDAFADLVQPYLALLSRYAQMRLRNPAEAEDVVQQSVLSALCHLGGFRREASFKTWLSTIAWNEVSQTRRRQVSASHRPLHECLTANLADPSCSPDSLAQKRQDIAHLRGALETLPEKYRLIIQLRDLSELSVLETARRLSLTAATVKTRHHRARKLLLRSFSRREFVRAPSGRLN
jgi:RNA polymerase sigma-70 factor (ECF subfamily)